MTDVVDPNAIPISGNEELQAEIVRLNKIVTALMNRAERSNNIQSSAYNLFQTALMLEQQVRLRTKELESALFENEKINTELQQASASMAKEIDIRKKAERLREAQFQILEMIAANIPLHETLSSLAKQVEQQLPGSATSVLLLSDAGDTVTSVIAPSLPSALNDQFVGLRIGPTTGSCGAAMYRKEQVVVADLSVDFLWRDCRKVVEPFGLRSCWSTPIITHDGKVLGSFATYHHMTYQPSTDDLRLSSSMAHLASIAIERSQSIDRIHHMAHHDALTGLPNRLLMHDRIEQTILISQRQKKKCAVLMTDLDRFKHVNDSLGHHIGDKLLQEVTKRLLQCLRRSDSVARFGGDEFVICLNCIDDESAVTAIATKILTVLSQSFTIDEHLIQIGGSLGGSLFPEHGETAAELLRTADTAMYAAKSRGRNNFQLFTAEMDKESQEYTQLISQLRIACAENQFVLHFQPQVCLSSGRIVGAEALLRWQHPSRGLIYPKDFIGLLEESGMIVEAGFWVISEACKQLEKWQEQGRDRLTLAVNVSAQQFMRDDFVEHLIHLLAQYHISAQQLELEFTEGVMFDRDDCIVKAMQQLRDHGVGLALDDFGTGYSSLSYLQKFPLTRLKVDRSFIQGIPAHTPSADITLSIIELAKHLRLLVVAEGVENEEQLKFLCDLHCDQAQGFLFSRPVEAATFLQLLQTQPYLKR